MHSPRWSPNVYDAGKIYRVFGIYKSTEMHANTTIETMRIVLYALFGKQYPYTPNNTHSYLSYIEYMKQGRTYF